MAYSPTQRTDDELKNFFKTGDKPTQEQFWDFIHSKMSTLKQGEGLLLEKQSDGSYTIKFNESKLKLPYQVIKGSQSSVTIKVGQEISLFDSPNETLTITVDASEPVYPYSGDAILMIPWKSSQKIAWTKGSKVTTLLVTPEAKNPSSAGLSGSNLVFSFHFEPVSAMDGNYNVFVNVSGYSSI